MEVSTHSRPKAAADLGKINIQTRDVSTHSRPKAAADRIGDLIYKYWVSTHSRPKAAATSKVFFVLGGLGFNTQPPEGGCILGFDSNVATNGFNTQPPEGGCLRHAHRGDTDARFQHTAARRRLRWGGIPAACHVWVSTHSRPKAAARYGH